MTHQIHIAGELNHRILNWPCDLEDDNERNAATLSEMEHEEPSPDSCTPPCGTSPRSSPASTDAERSSTAHSSELPLLGCEEDILIPTDEQINTTFAVGQRMWNSYLSRAGQLPSSSLPACCLQPSIMLKDIPPLPKHLRGKKAISGQALWNVPCPELADSEVRKFDNDEPWDPEHVLGAVKTFHLRIEEPTICRISSEPASIHQLAHPNGLAILALCWSYIFSAHLLEMQHRQMRYSKTMSPIMTRSLEKQHGYVIIYLGSSSKKLVRWLCAILAPGAGWDAQGSVPPWTAYYDQQDAQFLVSTDLSANEIAKEQPPSSSEAVDLMLEFCELYGFGSQPTEAFLMALLFPFHNAQGLQPRLPMPRIPRSSKPSHRAPAHIRNYLRDIRYYMTLALFVGPAIWSIFWEPGIQSNVASAWLGSIHEVLRPLLEVGNMALLAKVFAFRKPRLAPLWLGFLGCNSSQLLDMVRRFLTTNTEHPFGISLGHPDPDVAAWTGSKQSFLDEECSRLYTDHDMLISSADILRHRFPFLLAVEDIPYFGWQSFGTISKHQVEPELWPRLESPSPPRRYVHWLWWLGKTVIKGEECAYQRAVERGYLHDKRGSTGGSDDSTIQDFEQECTKNYIENITHNHQPPVQIGILKQGPSKKATVRVLKLGSWEACGDCTLDAMGIPGLRRHPWLRNERGI